MEIPILVAVAGAAALALLVVAIVVAVVAGTRRRRSRADLEAMLLAAQREVDDLRRRIDELTRPPVAEPPDFVITHVGDEAPEHATDDSVAVPDRLVLSATLGEPLVKVAAFSHGVRRALSAESRNRIWFEMRREVRASRRRRRQLRKQLERDYRARLRAGEDVA
jgi:hypothetical protein